MKKLPIALTNLLLIVLLLSCPLENPPKDQDETPLDQVATPIFESPTGNYSNDQSVTITCATLDADIHCTTGGPSPSGSSTVYTNPILMPGNVTSLTIRAIATKIGTTDSEVTSAGYIINYSQVSTPPISPPSYCVLARSCMSATPVAAGSF